jgi:hypothetical protein
MQLKFNNGIWDQRLKQKLHLGSKKEFYEALGQIIRLEVAKRAVEFSTGLRKLSNWTLGRRGLAPSKRKEEMSKIQPLEKN